MNEGCGLVGTNWEREIEGVCQISCLFIRQSIVKAEIGSYQHFCVEEREVVLGKSLISLVGV